MTTRIRLQISPTGHVIATNHSRETVSVKPPHAPDFLKIKPNTRFEGDYRKGRSEPLPPEAMSVLETTFASYPDGVRKAGPNDINDLTLFVPQILAETTLLPVSQDKIEELVDRCATGRSGSVAGIIEIGRASCRERV